MRHVPRSEALCTPSSVVSQVEEAAAINPRTACMARAVNSQIRMRLCAAGGRPGGCNHPSRSAAAVTAAACRPARDLVSAKCTPPAGEVLQAGELAAQAHITRVTVRHKFKPAA